MQSNSIGSSGCTVLFKIIELIIVDPFVLTNLSKTRLLSHYILVTYSYERERHCGRNWSDLTEICQVSPFNQN